MHWMYEPVAAPSDSGRQAASARQQQLTKPAGSLGRLEQVAIQFGGWQGRAQPVLERIAVRVFAADHGVTEEGVSAFPAAVTVQMIENFRAGGAAISVLSSARGADFAVVSMGTFEPVAPGPGLVQVAVAAGTENFTRAAAMTELTLDHCLQAGREQADALDCQLFIAGEMGIGNTTTAAAVTAALLGLDAAAVVGRGTGVDAAGLARKTAAVDAGLQHHRQALDSPLGVLRCVGGLEIAAMAGAYIRCAQRGIPILVDGFIATAAALAAVRINPAVVDWMLAAHQSEERAHPLLLEALGLAPLLQLQMRLGEGSGAAVAVGVIDSALLLHNSMATFAEAGVSEGETP